MSADIKPGDLVMVVRPSACCGESGHIGRIGIASLPPAWALTATCNFCGMKYFDTSKFFIVEEGGFHVDVLKKIDPPALADDTETAHELVAS